jgi:23S rRNA (cytidine1920-2'-O)/16S rRNA (cytidine1409-2'-O)-methyltransferase
VKIVLSMIADSKLQVNLTYRATAFMLTVMERERLDILLHRMGLAESRERARRLIMAGQVSVNGEVADKPGTRVPLTAEIRVGAEPPYVSRGGLKLEAALTTFSIDVGGLVAADIGASTGGFTDCLLQHGAARVYSIDVGYGQLAWKLRQDPRVVVMERINARYLQELPEAIDVATIDVSFISLKLVAPAAMRLLKPSGHILALVKPQFEAGREQVGKGGVVRDPAVHEAVLHDLLAWAPVNGLQTGGLIPSPLRGPAGNIEFLVHWVLGARSAEAGRRSPRGAKAQRGSASTPATQAEELIKAALAACQVGLDRL